MKKSLKTIFSICVIFALVVGCFTVTSFGAVKTKKTNKTKKMTSYRECIKKGKYVYCSTGEGIYKVDLNTRQVKLLVKAACADYEDIYYPPEAMRLYKGYIYYIDGDGGIGSGLFRVSTSGTNKKKLAVIEYDYAISKGKIYYKTYNKKNKVIKMQMKLNGKNKKKSSYNVSLTQKDKNKSGYYIDTRSRNGVSEDYLVTPKGRCELCAYEESYFE